MKYIKIYGLQRSGTNYLKALLEKNFDVRVLQNICGSKHQQITDGVTNMNHVKTDLSDAIIKQLDSMFWELPKICIRKSFVNWKKSFIKYQKSKGILIKDDKDLHSKYTKAINGWKEHCYVVKYEEIIKDYKVFCDQMKTQYGLTPKNKEYQDVEFYMKRGGDYYFTKNLTTIKIK